MKGIAMAFGVLAALCGCDGKPHVVGDRDGNSRAPSADVVPPSVGRGSAPVARQDSVAELRTLEGYLCGLDCADAGPFDARSAAEAAWLIKHGYPTKLEKFHLETISRDALDSEVASGNRAAAVELGRRIALEGNVLDGKIMLREQAQSGNLYAYYGLAEVSARADPPSLVDSAAYRRIAYMLGDDQAAAEIARMHLTSAELVAADQRASRMYSGYAGEQLRDPRPRE